MRAHSRKAGRPTLRARLLTALSGHPDGTPAWVRALADGDDAGYFADGGAVWTVHAGTGSFVAGIRALLLQALHPGALAGVHDFSRYREDPIGRLTGTVRWIICVTYGSTAQAARETARVARLHERVQGTFDAADGPRAYSAGDADLVEWVHLAFTEAFLGAHERWGGPIPGGPDAYVREWAQAGRLMRLENPPLTETELHARMDGFLERGELRRDERVDEVVRFLRDVPFTGMMRLAYRVLFAAAVASLPARYRRLLGVRRTLLPAITTTRVILAVSARALASGPRAQDFARERLRRLAAAAQTHAGTTPAAR
ncbi:oxygenase MpaB family protein [Microbacterium sp. M3]|uniref:Oxygenase MpaB family protein n=1 Tax=Microbacterium arthrosphaerae TaxID=792652 RepID=A0ABU4GZQ7_9MICO|nr:MULTISPECIES: oxygenase MpaB family protein [Microbacterium]MDW4571934.1 oxygenase MpaB family protein [Microbacterium arthrosphaerae]MDW7605789.1 oxygenase MpaB family protein [Microbacterium sp. M3]